ncbi:heat shock factor protein 5-like [Ictalurus punctatus]|uniref:Heat shock factor protein 5-like n=1 Tax=Ictalurus punctatus TaxID=7998 RepID=A0A9F7TM06_ICTPU|nr:heat shock factor protein 5-like [Ictalurus punctatus]
MENDETTFVTSINPNQFPGKLWRLVNDPQIRSIWWDASGEGILVNQLPFEAEVLQVPRQVTEYFRTTDFLSFVRQLNLYGFRKERIDFDISDNQPNISSTDAQLHHFHNPYFKRDKPELLVKLKRLTPLNKAKLAGREVPRRKSKRIHHAMLNSPQETSALMNTGSVSLGHQGTPYHHPCNGPQQEKDGDVLTSPPSSVMHMQQGVMPHHSQYGFYTPVYQCCSPDFLDSKVPCFQQPAASYSPCGYYPDYSVGYAHPIDQDPYWKAGDVPESGTSDLEKENLDTIFKLVEEMQVTLDDFPSVTAPSVYATAKSLGTTDFVLL